MTKQSYTVYEIIDYTNTTGETDRNTVNITNITNKQEFIQNLTDYSIIVQEQLDTNNHTIIKGYIYTGWCPSYTAIIIPIERSV